MRDRSIPCKLHALGIVSALGAGVEEHRGNLFSAFPHNLRRAGEVMPELDSATVSRFGVLGAVTTPLQEVPPDFTYLRSRNASLILTAISQIFAEIVRARDTFGKKRVGIVIGSSTSGIAAGEAAIIALETHGSRPAEYSYTQQEMSAAAEIISQFFGLQGPAYTISTACSSSAKAFAAARSLLRSDLCDAVIVGGADTLCRLTIEGFAALELLSPIRTNPFSKNRSGISIGEGAAIFLLTKEQGGIQLIGVGESSDAYHISSPEPEGKGAEAALRAAIADANISANDISYLNLHGTGTPANDSMESRAVFRVFGERAQSSLCLSSTKPLTGHTLGACGAIEIGICWLMLQEYLKDSEKCLLPIPTHYYDGNYDEELPPLNLVVKETAIPLPKQAICASNSFGFGGSNCAIILGASF